MKKFFMCFWKYLWPMLITGAVIAFCFFIQSLDIYDELLDIATTVTAFPLSLGFGNSGNGFLVSSAWCMDVVDAVSDVVDSLGFFVVILFPLLIVAYVGVFVVFGLLQLILIIVFAVVGAAWWVVSSILFIIIEFGVVFMPVLMVGLYIFLVIKNIKEEGRELPVIETIDFVLLTALQIGAAVIFYISFWHNIF